MKTIDLSDRIRNAGFRATAQRTLLLSFLQSRKYPVSVQEIAESLSRKKIDQATVYRMVGQFERAGLVKEIASQHGVAHYEYNDLSRDHDHIVCASCHKVEDLSNMHEKNIERKALKKSHAFSTIQAHSLTLWGLCRSCAA